jgi:integrase
MPNDADRIRVGDHVTIYPRGKKGTWCADFWRDGVHCRVSLKTRNKKIAFQRALHLDAKLGSGTYQAPPAPVTVGQAAEDYLKYLETEDRASKTLVKYKGICESLVAFLEELGPTRMAQFTPTVFDKFRAFRKEDHHRKTLYTEGVVIKQLFKWARSRKLIVENQIADYPLDKPPLEPREGPSLQQVNRILAALEKSDLIAIAVLAFTGMRAGELQRLQPADIDLAGNWTHIRSREGLETKTGCSRKVPIHVRLRPLLEALPKQPRTWLFTNAPSKKYPEGNQPLCIKKLNERFQKVVAGLGMAVGRKQDGFTLHSLRHFFETFTVNALIPQRAVDTWLGHRSDKSMAAVYYKLKDEESQHFMKKVPFGTGKPAAHARKG